MVGCLALACQSGAVLKPCDFQTWVIHDTAPQPKLHAEGGQVRIVKGINLPDNPVQALLETGRITFLQTQEKVIRFHPGGKFIIL